MGREKTRGSYGQLWNQPSSLKWRSLGGVGGGRGGPLALNLALWLTVCLLEIPFFELDASAAKAYISTGTTKKRQLSGLRVLYDQDRYQTGQKGVLILEVNYIKSHPRPSLSHTYTYLHQSH